MHASAFPKSWRSISAIQVVSDGSSRAFFFLLCQGFPLPRQRSRPPPTLTDTPMLPRRSWRAGTLLRRATAQRRTLALQSGSWIDKPLEMDTCAALPKTLRSYCTCALCLPHAGAAPSAFVCWLTAPRLRIAHPSMRSRAIALRPGGGTQHATAHAHLSQTPASPHHVIRRLTQARPARSKIVHAGVNPDPITGAILTPIYQSTTYIQESIEKYLDKGERWPPPAPRRPPLRRLSAASPPPLRRRQPGAPTRRAVPPPQATRTPAPTTRR